MRPARAGAFRRVLCWAAVSRSSEERRRMNVERRIAHSTPDPDAVISLGLSPLAPSALGVAHSSSMRSLPSAALSPPQLYACPPPPSQGQTQRQRPARGNRAGRRRRRAERTALRERTRAMGRTACLERTAVDREQSHKEISMKLAKASTKSSK